MVLLEHILLTMELGVLIDVKHERYMKEPSLGGVGNRRRRNPYTANHNALPLRQANLLEYYPL